MDLNQYSEYFNGMARNMAAAFASPESAINLRKPRQNSVGGAIPGIMFVASITRPDYSKLPAGLKDAMYRLDSRFGIQKALEFLSENEPEIYKSIAAKIPAESAGAHDVNGFKAAIQTAVNEAGKRTAGKASPGPLLTRLNAYIEKHGPSRPETYDVNVQIMYDRQFMEQPFGIVVCDGITSRLLTQTEALKVERDAPNSHLDSSEASLYSVEQGAPHSSKRKSASSFAPSPASLSQIKAYAGEIIREAYPGLPLNVVDDIAAGVDIRPEMRAYSPAAAPEMK